MSSEEDRYLATVSELQALAARAPMVSEYTTEGDPRLGGAA